MDRKSSLVISIPDRLYKGLQVAAAQKGMTRQQYATMLLEAAHAARFGGTGDGRLEDVVAASLLLWGGGFNTATTAKVLNISEPQVERIIRQWKSRPRREAA